MLPARVRWSIKAAFPPKDALDYEACLEKRLAEITEQQGHQYAAKWLWLETSALMVQALIRLGRTIGIGWLIEHLMRR